MLSESSFDVARRRTADSKKSGLALEYKPLSSFKLCECCGKLPVERTGPQFTASGCSRMAPRRFVPEGANAEKATARFNNGVLNVVIPIPEILPKTRKARQSRPKPLIRLAQEGLR